MIVGVRAVAQWSVEVAKQVLQGEDVKQRIT